MAAREPSPLSGRGRDAGKRRRQRKEAGSEVGSALGAVSVASYTLGSSAVSVAPDDEASRYHAPVQNRENQREPARSRYEQGGQIRRSSFDAGDLLEGGAISPRGSAARSGSRDDDDEAFGGDSAGPPMPPPLVSTADILAERRKIRRPVKRFTSLSTVASESLGTSGELAMDLSPHGPEGEDEDNAGEYSDRERGYGMSPSAASPSPPYMKSANRPRPVAHDHEGRTRSTNQQQVTTWDQDQDQDQDRNQDKGNGYNVDDTAAATGSRVAPPSHVFPAPSGASHRSAPPVSAPAHHFGSGEQAGHGGENGPDHSSGLGDDPLAGRHLRGGGRAVDTRRQTQTQSQSQSQSISQRQEPDHRHRTLSSGSDRVYGNTAAGENVISDTRGRLMHPRPQLQAPPGILPRQRGKPHKSARDTKSVGLPTSHHKRDRTRNILGASGGRRGSPATDKARSVASTGAASRSRRAAAAGNTGISRNGNGPRDTRSGTARLTRGRSNRSLRSDLGESASGVWQEVLSEAGRGDSASQQGGSQRSHTALGRDQPGSGARSLHGAGETSTVLSALDDDIEMERLRLQNDKQQAQAQDAARTRQQLVTAETLRKEAVRMRQLKARETAEQRIREASQHTAAAAAGTAVHSSSVIISEGTPGHPGVISSGIGSSKSRSRRETPPRARTISGSPSTPGSSHPHDGRSHSASRSRRERSDVRSAVARRSSSRSRAGGVAMPNKVRGETRAGSRNRLVGRRGSDVGPRGLQGLGTSVSRKQRRRDSSATSVASGASEIQGESAAEALDRRRAVWIALEAESTAGDVGKAEDKLKRAIKIKPKPQGTHSGKDEQVLQRKQGDRVPSASPGTGSASSQRARGMHVLHSKGEGIQQTQQVHGIVAEVKQEDDLWERVDREVDGALAPPADGEEPSSMDRPKAVLQAARTLKQRQLSFDEFRRSALAGLRDAARRVQLAQRRVEDDRFALTGVRSHVGSTSQVQPEGARGDSEEGAHPRSSGRVFTLASPATEAQSGDSLQGTLFSPMSGSQARSGLARGPLSGPASPIMYGAPPVPPVQTSGPHAQVLQELRERAGLPTTGLGGSSMLASQGQHFHYYFMGGSLPDGLSMGQIQRAGSPRQHTIEAGISHAALQAAAIALAKQPKSPGIGTSNAGASTRSRPASPRPSRAPPKRRPLGSPSGKVFQIRSSPSDQPVVSLLTEYAKAETKSPPVVGTEARNAPGGDISGSDHEDDHEDNDEDDDDHEDDDDPDGNNAAVAMAALIRAKESAIKQADTAVRKRRPARIQNKDEGAAALDNRPARRNRQGRSQSAHPSRPVARRLQMHAEGVVPPGGAPPIPPPPHLREASPARRKPAVSILAGASNAKLHAYMHGRDPPPGMVQRLPGQVHYDGRSRSTGHALPANRQPQLGASSASTSGPMSSMTSTQSHHRGRPQRAIGLGTGHLDGRRVPRASTRSRGRPLDRSVLETKERDEDKGRDKESGGAPAGKQEINQDAIKQNEPHADDAHDDGSDGGVEDAHGEDEDEDAGNLGPRGRTTTSNAPRKSLAAKLVAGIANSLVGTGQGETSTVPIRLLDRAREHGDRAREKAGRSRSVGKSAMSMFKGIANMVGLRARAAKRGPLGKQPWLPAMQAKWSTLSTWEHISGNVPADCLVPVPVPPVKPEGRQKVGSDDDDEDDDDGAESKGGTAGWRDDESTGTSTAARRLIGLPAVGASIPMSLDVVPLAGLEEAKVPVHFPREMLGTWLYGGQHPNVKFKPAGSHGVQGPGAGAGAGVGAGTSAAYDDPEDDFDHDEGYGDRRAGREFFPGEIQTGDLAGNKGSRGSSLTGGDFDLQGASSREKAAWAEAREHEEARRRSLSRRRSTRGSIVGDAGQSLLVNSSRPRGHSESDTSRDGEVGERNQDLDLVAVPEGRESEEHEEEEEEGDEDREDEHEDRAILSTSRQQHQAVALPRAESSFTRGEGRGRRGSAAKLRRMGIDPGSGSGSGSDSGRARGRTSSGTSVHEDRSGRRDDGHGLDDHGTGAGGAWEFQDGTSRRGSRDRLDTGTGTDTGVGIGVGVAPPGMSDKNGRDRDRDRGGDGDGGSSTGSGPRARSSKVSKLLGL